MSKKKSKKPQAKKPSRAKAIAKRIAAAVLAIALVVGSVKGGQYVYAGMPHYKAGDCLLDEADQLVVAVTGIDKEKKQYEIVLIPLQLMGLVQIPARSDFRKMNAVKMTRISCETGEPLDAKSSK